MKDKYVPQGQDVHLSTLDKAKRDFKIAREKALTWIAVASAIGFITACQDGQIKVPFLDKPPTPTFVPNTPTPVPTPTEIPRPTPEPTPIRYPTKTPKPIYPWQLFPTPEPFPTRAPTPTPTPVPAMPFEPIPTPESAATPTPSPSREQDIKLKPGAPPKEWEIEVHNPFEDSRKRSIDLGFVLSKDRDRLGLSNERKSVETKIFAPKDSKTSIAENASFTVESGKTMQVKIVVIIPPGAEPGCFSEVNYVVKGVNNSEISLKIPLTHENQKFCVEESVITQFESLYYDPTPNEEVFAGRINVRNTANVGQMIQLEITDCTFTIIEKQAKKGSQTSTLLDKYTPLLPNTADDYDVIFKPKPLKKGETYPYPYNCKASPKRDFDKQIPAPKL